ncbi:MAG: inorganic phosphate transporter [Candidatus Eremiobacterota bacterium]
MESSLLILLVAVVIIALAFDYVNGFHDAANAIATVVSTRALSPRVALMVAGFFNFVGAFLFEGVAKTIGKGLVDAESIHHQEVILAALLGAIAWNLLTWWWGLPSSSSHALVGGLIGAVLFFKGSRHVLWHGVLDKVLLPGLVAPALGLVVGFFMMGLLMWTFRWANPWRINKIFKRCQWLSASLMALSHGTNDAQKVMGIITLALVTAGVQEGFHVQPWVKFACASAIAMGTAAGGWRIIKTMGGKVVKLQPINGFAAELTSGTVLMGTGALGFPVSTTHVITGAIMGVGASKRISAVRWGVAGNIMVAWVLTIPAAALMGGLAFWLVSLVSPSV